MFWFPVSMYWDKPFQRAGADLIRMTFKLFLTVCTLLLDTIAVHQPKRCLRMFVFSFRSLVVVFFFCWPHQPFISLHGPMRGQKKQGTKTTRTKQQRTKKNHWNNNCVHLRNKTIHTLRFFSVIFLYRVRCSSMRNVMLFTACSCLSSKLHCCNRASH